MIIGKFLLMWACKYGLMCVTCIDLGWAAVDKIFKDQGSNPSQSIRCFFFVISFNFFVCPNIK
jgi:hypothetical protein